MARRRMIDPGIWQSEAFARLGDRARILYIGMFSNADDHGRGRARPAYLRSVVFPYDEELTTAKVQAALTEIARWMNVTLYEHEGGCYYAFTNWRAWQRIEKPQPSRLPPPPGEEENDDTPESGQAESIPQKTWNDSAKSAEWFREKTGTVPHPKERKGKEEKRREREGARARAAPPRGPLNDNPFRGGRL